MANRNRNPYNKSNEWQPTRGKGAAPESWQVEAPYKPEIGKGAPGPFQQDRNRDAYEAERDEYKKAMASGNPTGPGLPGADITIGDYNKMRSDATAAYSNRPLGYNPYMAQAGPQMKGMNYNPYRSAANNAAQSQAVNQFGSQQGQLLSGSDRMKAFSDFNRQKIMGTLGANTQYDQAQSQNQLDVGRFNATRDFNVNAANIGAQNQANQYAGMVRQGREQNLYQDAIQQRDLDRRLKASRLISEAQMRNGGKPRTDVEFILDPLDIVNDRNKKYLDPFGSHSWF